MVASTEDKSLNTKEESAETIDTAQKEIHRDSCPQCGRKKYIPETTFQLHAKQSYLDPGIDFYSTESIFGSGREHPILIASNRVYRILRNMKLIRNLCFEPVILTD